MSDNPIGGELFTRNYHRPTTRLSDSIRARRRALEVFGEHQPRIGIDFVSLAQRELGVDYPYGGYDYDHKGFWTECEARDFLDSITLVFRLLQTSNHNSGYLEEMRKIFSQENLHYRIDDSGGVHYLVDEEFSRTTESTLRGLGAPRFSGARQALEFGIQALSAKNLSGKALIRGVFEAAESTFLILVSDPQVKLLNERTVDTYLKPKLMDRYKRIPDADDKVSRVLDTFNRWIKSAHPYRHGAAFEDIHEAPIDEAILQASVGMAFIRYMVSGED